jgi:hypothetical protein
MYVPGQHVGSHVTRQTLWASARSLLTLPGARWERDPLLHENGQCGGRRYLRAGDAAEGCRARWPAGAAVLEPTATWRLIQWTYSVPASQSAASHFCG